MKRRNYLGATCALVVALAAHGAPAWANDAAITRPVKLVTPASPGSTIDTIARFIAPHLSAKWGQPVVVENVAGAGGVLGVQAVLRSSPDALTLGVVASNLAVSPALLKKAPYDLAKDFSYVAYLASAPMVLYAHPSVSASTFKELQQVAVSRNRPFTFSSAGTGSTGHLAGELIAESTKLPLDHISYKVVGQALTDAIGGQVDLFIAAASVGAEQVKSGRLKAIVHTGTGKLATLPSVPSLPETGAPEARIEAWFGVIGPASLAPGVRTRIERDLLAVAGTEAFKEFAAQQGLQQGARDGQAFAALVKREAQRWKAMADKGVISAQ